MMHLRYESLILPGEEIGEEDVTSDPDQNVWDFPELFGSVIKEPTYASRDLGPARSPDFPMHHTTQNPYSVDCTSVMHDSRWRCSAASDSRDVFQSRLHNADHTRFAGDLDSSIPTSGIDGGDSTPATVPSSMLEWGVALQSLSPLPLSPSSLTSPTTIADQAKPHPCPSCPKMSFKYNKDLKRHISTKHPTGCERVYRCRCGKSDFRKDNHLRHVGTCTRTRGGIYYACRCLSIYEDKETYIGHVQSRPNAC